MDRFVGYIETDETISKGPTRASVVLRPGLQVDLRCVPEESFGAAMVYFTGSKAHNVAIRRMAQLRGLKMNEYGVFRDDTRIAGETEESVYATIGLPWIAPELRENRGEVEAALAGTLPNLVELSALRGDLNVRSKGMGGADTLEVLVGAAEALGFEYLALVRTADHFKTAADAQAARDYLAEIDRFNSANSGFTLLKAIEVDIREDGSLDVTDEMLLDCDLVIASIATALDLPRAEQTDRVLRALDHPRLAVLALPRHTSAPDAGRVDLDLAAVMRKAKQRDVAVEISLHGRRVAMVENYCSFAKQEGVLLSISADASRLSDFDMLSFTTGSARRAWVKRHDTLNAKPLTELRDWLAKHRP
jgi:DNA polymerase (family 10)